MYPNRAKSLAGVLGVLPWLGCIAAPEVVWRTYEQTLLVTYETPEQAQRAALEALPLPPGKRVAFSTRWDDSVPSGVEKAEVLAEHGYKGTFYLNKVDAGGYADGSIMRRLLDLGSSVGAHTCTHPYLTKIDANAMFREILLNRIEIESRGKVCVNSFTLPYMAYESETDSNMPAKIGECLVRAGLHGGDEVWPDVASRFKRSPNEWIGGFTFDINDTNPKLSEFETNIGRGLKAVETGEFECGPHLSLGIHNWQSDMQKFGAVIATQANNRDWWYCNANEYVAYRLEALNTLFVKKSVTDSEATFTVCRLLPFETGARLPLGIRASAGVATAIADGHALEAFGGGVFTLPHDAAHQLPIHIGAVFNKANLEAEAALEADPTLPGFAISLHADLAGNRLVCVLENKSETAIEGPMALTFRLPLKWKNGIFRQDIAPLAAGEQRRIEVPMGDVDNNHILDVGVFFFAVQCDFVTAEGTSRLYATAEAAPLQPNAVAAQIDQP